MQPDTVSKLILLNEQFYQTFAGQFSKTRQRLQPGVRSLLPDLMAESSLLDLGCGNGELARQLAQAGYQGIYAGLDSSADLLKIARDGLPEGFNVQLIQASLYEADWEAKLPQNEFQAILAFAVLHHLPGAAQRRSLLLRLRRLLATDGLFIHSNWQFLRSERMRLRIQPWESAGLNQADVEAGDYLLDWRQGGTGLRYVHEFTLQELEDLAAETGFQVLRSFSSDGKSGDLSLYQVWKVVTLKNTTWG